MPGRDEHASEHWTGEPQRRLGGAALALAAVARALEAESDRFAMPFGLEFWPLQIMGLGIDLLVATGKWVAS